MLQDQTSKKHDSRLITQELGKFNFNINGSNPNGFEKYMGFNINDKLIIISCFFFKLIR